MKILAVDLGHARTGLAICDEGEILASPLMVLPSYNWDKLLIQVAEQVEKTGAGAVVVGLPKNMDGTEGESAQNARDFAQKLSKQISVPVHLQDERCTTMVAHTYLIDTNVRGKKRKAVVDAVAATIILQDYLSAHS
ncbi:Holliday junction resolvase RuvX [Caproicibacterium sp. BJN0003]|uniref:Holliday junction resolvase RuvX n=1 Tax=Caproicibacterium sp. BJN0003 TaxID=2994078 RepID=UPI002259C4EC|nr:Holliday junction resolvase RuvX [Caproicibacterium sp. BJN0003]UZT81889.1 Holliday junction resolvase RuvX [Caproicibacterium sp. BJN0003]